MASPSGKMRPIMKKIFYLTVVSMLLGMASCSTNEEFSAEPMKSAVSFTASFDGESRTEIVGKQVNWIKGDSIGIVHSGSFRQDEYDEGYSYIQSSLYTTQDEGSTASFQKDEYAESPSGTSFYGVYPAWGLDWCTGSLSEDYFVMDLRCDQKVNPAGGFCYPHPYMLAYTENNELNFKNICTMFEIKIASEGIREILLEGENLAGICRVSGIKTGNFSYNPDKDSHGNEAIYISGRFVTGTTIYAFAWPTTTKLRMSVNGELVKELTSEKEFKRNTIYNLGEVKLPNYIYVYNCMEQQGSTKWCNQMNLWSWNDSDEAINYTGGVWPGVVMTAPDTENWEDLYSYEMPEEARGEVIRLLFNDGKGSYQTQNSLPFILNRNFYLRVHADTDNNGRHLISFAHDWDYYYESGSREIYVPVESVPADWEELYIYAYDEANGNQLLTAAWPGERMDEYEWQIYRFSNGKDYYCYNNFSEMTMDRRIKIIFNDGKSGGQAHQTQNIDVQMSQNRCFVLSNAVDAAGYRAYSEELSPCYQWEQVWW